MKFGYQGGFSNPTQTYQNFTQVVQVRTNNGVPNQLTQTHLRRARSTSKYIRNLMPTNFYAQDQWTRNRLTLQGGVRYDQLTSSYPDQRIGGPGWPYAPAEIFYPAGSTPGYDWKDITPRMGVAYDLFGNGKTAVKFNLGKYLEAITASNNDLDMNPLIRTAISTTRDVDRLRTGTSCRTAISTNPAAERRMRGDGQPEPRASGVHPDLRPGLRRRLGHPAVQLGMGLSVQQEIAPRVSVTVGYYRNWWGNWYVVDNRSTTLADYTPFSIMRADRSAAAGRRRLDDRRPVQPRAGQGRAGGRARAILEQLRGADGELAGRGYLGRARGCGTGSRCRAARAPGAGSRTAAPCGPNCRSWAPGRRAATNSSVTANVNALGGGPFALSVNNPYCRIAEPYRTDFRGLATYVDPEGGRPAGRRRGRASPATRCGRTTR